MREEKFFINDIPAILVGEPCDNVFIFVHGQGGNKEEAVDFAKNICSRGWQVLGIDLPEHGERKDEKKFLPYDAVPELKEVYKYAKKKWKKISLRANSIGSWFSMLAFKDDTIEKCLLVSPIVDMERLIENMIQWAGVSEEQLEKEKEIETDFGQTLSWDYLCYVRNNVIDEWNSTISVLYPSGDNMTSRDTIDKFIKKFNCKFTIMENGEHWFHTPEQVKFMRDWELKNI